MELRLDRNRLIASGVIWCAPGAPDHVTSDLLSPQSLRARETEHQRAFGDRAPDRTAQSQEKHQWGDIVQ
jgi:hypothetical protein